MAYNSYINSFATSGDYETYINGSTAKAPNVGYLKDSGVVKYASRLPNDYVVFGTTTGTTDFTSCGIQFKVEQPLGGGDNILYVEASGVPQSLTSLSSCFNNTEGKKITKIAKWVIDTSDVTSIGAMFNSCSNLTSVDFSSLNTSNVTNMSEMFFSCSNLTSLDLSSFDTSNVTNIGAMFYGCSNLASLDLSSFDTSKVTNIGNMFKDCLKINKLYISSSFFNSASITKNQCISTLVSYYVYYQLNLLLSVDYLLFSTH